MRKGILLALGVTLVSSRLAFGQVLPEAEKLGSGPDSPVSQKEPEKAAPATEPESAVSKKEPAGKDMAPATDAVNQAPVFTFDDQSPMPRLWLSAEYLLWWVKNGPSVPLIGTGSLADQPPNSSGPPGAIGQPNSQTLYGDHGFDFGAFSGMRVGAGFRLNNCLAVEGNYFFLASRTAHFQASSDANGNPLLGRLYFNTHSGVEDSLLFSNPDPANSWAGFSTVDARSRLQGYEINLAGIVSESSQWRLTAIAGFRALDLNEDLFIQDTVLPPGTGNLTFLGAANDPSTTMTDYDHFHAVNHFYGGQVGARLEWLRGNLSLALCGKVALGGTQQFVTIDGASILTSPNLPTQSALGGLYAQSTNIGHYSRGQFSVVPEAQATAGWQIASWLKANIGYNFIYWSNVVRPGNQIDRNVNGALVPTNGDFSAAATQGPPFFSFHNSGFWAQGINFGLTFSF